MMSPRVQNGSILFGREKGTTEGFGYATAEDHVIIAVLRHSIVTLASYIARSNVVETLSHHIRRNKSPRQY